MKKFLLWIGMVLLFIALLLGGTVWYFYSTATLEAPGALTIGESALPYTGYDYQLPILGGILFKRDAQAVDRVPIVLETDQDHLEIAQPEEESTLSLTVSRYQDELFSGTLADYASFRFPANGTYFYRVTQSFAPAAEEERPRAYGSVTYEFEVRVSVQLSVTCAPETAKQGDLVLVRVGNNLDNTMPTGSFSDGTQLNFVNMQGNYAAYLAIPYAQETGDYQITVDVGGAHYELPLRVEYVTYTKIEIADAAQLPDASGDESPAAVEQFRNAVWPLYEKMSPTALWSGGFQPLIAGVPVRYGYGTGSLLPGAATSIRHAGLDYTAPKSIAEGSGESAVDVLAPNAGQVVFAGELALTGNTIVIEHGGGLKSFLYHLSSLAVSTGAEVTKGQKLGTLASEKTLHYEVRVGNKTVDPARLLDGSSALYR